MPVQHIDIARWEVQWYEGKRRIAQAIHLDLTHNQERYANELRNAVRPGDRWLDVGCGHSLVPDWAMPPEEQERLVRRAAFLVGVDVNDGIARHRLLTYRIKAIGEQLPFKDGTFDLVTANMVMEHVVDPASFLQDVFRVLRPGGHFLFVTPNRITPMLAVSRAIPDGIKKRAVRFLEQRDFEDIFPTVYRMNGPKEIRTHSDKIGFTVEHLQLIGSSGEFDRLGPMCIVECIVLKGMQDLFHGRLQPDILAVLTRRNAA